MFKRLCSEELWIFSLHASSFLTIGDINGDNNEDIIILDSQGTHLKIFLNFANGQLTEEKKFSTGYTTVKISTGDMNHDKKVDVITTDFWTHAIIILYNTGDETFYHRVISTNLYGANVRAISDINNDKIPDVIMTNYSPGEIG
ncbi:unnamed protein product, partial [Adineta steineri]